MINAPSGRRPLSPTVALILQFTPTIFTGQYSNLPHYGVSPFGGGIYSKEILLFTIIHPLKAIIGGPFFYGY